MKPTTEQQAILDHLQTDEATKSITLVSSIAGSGKTSLLVQAAKTLNSTAGIYLAYTKSVATEATLKFPRGVHCCTTHALAYQAIVKPYKLKLGVFSHRSFAGKLRTYKEREEAFLLVKEFCLSSHRTIENLMTTKARKSPSLAAACNKVMDEMATGKLECGHEFYLKLFHLYLADGTTTYETSDLLMLDEAGDLNEVTLEIFKLLPATRKVLVGDPYQNIFGFNHTVNCFQLLKDIAPIFPMSQSFRTSTAIASRIEGFCKKFLSPDMTFRGVELTDTSIATRAFITRNNAALINKMMDLNAEGEAYGLVRSPDQIFNNALTLCSLKHKGFIHDPAFRFIQAEVDYFFENRDTVQQNSVIGYIRAIYPEDDTIQQTCRLIAEHGVKAIFDCHKTAKAHYRKKQSYLLGTAHSVKG